MFFSRMSDNVPSQHQGQLLEEISTLSLEEVLYHWIGTMDVCMTLGHHLFQRLNLQTQNEPALAPVPHEPEVMEVAFQPPALDPEPHPGNAPLQKVPTNNAVYKGIWDLACIGLLPPDLSEGMMHLMHQYFRQEHSGDWHCADCHEKEFNNNLEDYKYVETHCTIWLQNFNQAWDPKCRCGASVARVVEVGNCIPCQKVVALNRATLLQEGQCLAAAPRELVGND